uniref:Uncharacterized protein n=1 Tax=Rhizophora mucronata TaxID=61149 RepID=A0A2P2KKB6_RHIMU
MVKSSTVRTEKGTATSANPRIMIIKILTLQKIFVFSATKQP